MIAERRTLTGMTQQERRDLTRLYGQTPHGVLFTLVEPYGAVDAGARMYEAPDAARAGSMFHDAVQRYPMQVGAGAQLHAGVLMEHGNAPEAMALMEACMAALAGELRVVATILPEGDITLLRFVMDERGDVLFASEMLETEDIVPLRRLARVSAHGVIHVSSQGRLFVERLEASGAEVRILENDTPHAEAE